MPPSVQWEKTENCGTAWELDVSLEWDRLVLWQALLQIYSNKIAL